MLCMSRAVVRFAPDLLGMSDACQTALCMAIDVTTVCNGVLRLLSLICSLATDMYGSILESHACHK